MKKFDLREFQGMDGRNFIQDNVEKKIVKLDEDEHESDSIDYVIALVKKQSNSYREMDIMMQYIIKELIIFHKNIKKLSDEEDGVNV
jgi:hypothetical protein